MAIDPTATERLAKYANHSTDNPPCIARRKVDLTGRVTIVITSVRAISEGEEIMYPYGENRPELINLFPWLKEKVIVL